MLFVTLQQLESRTRNVFQFIKRLREVYKIKIKYYISYWLYSFLVEAFSIMPFWMIYSLSNWISVLLRKVFHYRRDIVRGNLKLSFPEKSDEELQEIERLTYLNLTDILLETIKMPSLHPDELTKRFHFIPDRGIEEAILQKKSIVVASAHFGNWEWGALAAPSIVAPLQAIGFYKPLSNPLIDQKERNNRGRYGLSLFSMFQTTKTFNINRKQPSAFFLIADQSPSDRKTAIWIDFLHQPTPWLHGLERHSRFYNYPVFLFVAVRGSRGFYEIEARKLADNPASLPQYELTRLYSSALQDYIEKNPEQWLWTHRRWKMKPVEEM